MHEVPIPGDERGKEQEKTPLELFQSEIARMKKGAETSVIGSGALTHLYRIVPHELSDADRVIWESYKAGTLNRANFDDHRGTLDQRNYPVSRGNFVAMIANMVGGWDVEGNMFSTQIK